MNYKFYVRHVLSVQWKFYAILPLILKANWRLCMCAKLLQSFQLCAVPGTVAHQAPLSMGFSRQEYWSVLPFPFPGDLPTPRFKPGSPTLQADSLPTDLPGNSQIGPGMLKLLLKLRGSGAGLKEMQMAGLVLGGVLFRRGNLGGSQGRFVENKEWKSREREGVIARLFQANRELWLYSGSEK